MKVEQKPPDLVILHNGGGTQSGTIMEMIADGLIEKPDAILQADTGDEPNYIYKQWERDKSLAKRVSIPYLVVSNGNMIEDLYSGGRFAAMPVFTLRKNGSRGKKKKINKNQLMAFPLDSFNEKEKDNIHGFGLSSQIIHKGKMKRQCTSEYKITPIEREIRIMLLEMRKAKETKSGQIRINKGVMVESWLGYTIDEVQRVKRSDHFWQYFRYPLIEMKMTKQGCRDWLTDNNKPPRLSSFCRICPLVGNPQLRELRDNDKKGWTHRLRVDYDLRNGNLKISATAKGELYLSDKFIPMEDVDIDKDSPHNFLCSNIGCMT